MTPTAFKELINDLDFSTGDVFCAGFHFSFLSRIFPVDDGNSFRL